MTDHSIGLDKTIQPDDRADRASLRPGAVIGQYRIIRLLGRGGMGEVYEAPNHGAR